MAITDEQWRENAVGIPATLGAVPRSEDDDGLREAMLVVWAALAMASSTIKHLYSLVRESEILEVAATIDVRAPDYGVFFDGSETYQEIVKRLGGCLRAMEIEYTGRDLGSRPTDPAEWFVDQGGHRAYLIPMGRVAWRDARDPTQDMRNFDQRGLLRLRFVPEIVDGATVRLVKGDRIAKRKSSAFGAVLFPNPAFDCDETPTKFHVKAVGIPNGEAIIAAACKAAHDEVCLTAVFPELMIDPASRQMIKAQLAEKPWLADGEMPETPGIVVAGSWHEVENGKRYNIATIYDGHGDQLARHKKRMAYKDHEGRVEDIQHGTEFALLVLEEALFGFGICLDFCNRCYHTPYGWLDVDYVIVPSCGNDATMDGHIRTARDLHNERNTRSFVVQQAYPPLQQAAGYVLNPDGNSSAWAINTLLVGGPWSVFRARSNQRVRDSIDVWAHFLADQMVPHELHSVEKDLGAMQAAVRNLMGPVHIVTHAKPPSGWIDPSQIVAEAMSTARDLDPNLHATASFGNVPRVRGAVSPLRTILSHMVLIGTRHGAYDFHGALKGSNLVATVRVKARGVHQYLDPFEAVTNSGLGYCRAIVETNGGAFEMRDSGSGSDTMMIFSLPVEETVSQGGGVKFGPSVKATKSRKAPPRSHG